MKSAMEVEVLADNEPAPASTSSFDEKHDLSIYEAPLAGSVRVQYQPTLSLFEFLLEERSSAAEAKSPIDAQVEEKVSALGLLQAELGHCTAALMSEKRQRWLADKAALEEQKRACKAKWAELQARHAEAADAWKALADKAEEGSKQARPPRRERGTSALVASQDGVAVPRIFAKTSPKAQIALLTEQVATSHRSPRPPIDIHRSPRPPSDLQPSCPPLSPRPPTTPTPLSSATPHSPCSPPDLPAGRPL